MSSRALTLPDAVAARVASGHPLIRIDSLPQPGPASEAGSVLLLLDGRGTTMGTGLADPDNRVVRVLSREAEGSLGTSFFRRRVSVALELRRRLGLVGGGSAYRLLNGEGDGVSGFAADVYGAFVVLYAYSRGLVNTARALADAVLEIHQPRGVVLKVRPRGGPRPGKVREEVIGETPPDRLIVEEAGTPYETHLLGSLNVGLFTDMREHRRRLGRFVSGRRVLNTFAYTGAFSVAAARAGAAAVTSVDLSSGVLRWARENFRLSGLDPAGSAFLFEASDVVRFIDRELERGREYDTVILDPPTYSSARASAWSAKNHYPDLVSRAARLLPSAGGILFVATNTLRGPPLELPLETGLSRSGRDGAVLERGGLPPDYPTPVSFPEARYLQVAAVRVL